MIVSNEEKFGNPYGPPELLALRPESERAAICQALAERVQEDTRTAGLQPGDGSKTAGADANRRMSVMPAAPDAAHIATRRAQLTELLTSDLGALGGQWSTVSKSE